MIKLDEILSLVDKYGNAAGRAAVSNSGLCINPFGSLLWKDMQKLRTKLKADINNLWEAANKPTEPDS